MFSKATEYALRAVIFLAQKSAEDHKLSLLDIANGIDSPAPFTAKILQQLTADNRIVHSVRGPHGGFYISPKAHQLPARAILEIMNELDVLQKCVLGLKNCSNIKPCPMHDEYKLIRQQLVTVFDQKTIGELAKEMTQGAAHINNKRR